MSCQGWIIPVLYQDKAVLTTTASRDYFFVRLLGYIIIIHDQLLRSCQFTNVLSFPLHHQTTPVQEVEQRRPMATLNMPPSWPGNWVSAPNYL